MLLTVSEVEIQDMAGTMTSSPTPMPKALSKISIESVPLPQAMQCFTPTNWAKDFSNCLTGSPPTNVVVISIS